MDMILNWLVQGAIVAILAAAALRLIPRTRAQARYGVLWAAYLLILVLPIVPLLLSIVFGGPAADRAPVATGFVVRIPATWWASPAAAAGLWTIWACIHAMRLAVGALGVRRARRRARACPASVLARLPHWSRVRVTGRRARVVLSEDVRAAAVLGCGAPAIALAPALVEQLAAADLDRVLVHEWAHVQRRDDVTQLAQRIIRAAIGWHPAAWWLEPQLEFEREAACDEIAVAVTGSAKGYATCLAMLAARPESRARAVTALAAAAPSRLRARIVRILAAPCDAATRPWRAITFGGGSGLLACALVVGNLQLAAAAVTPEAVADPPRSELAAAPVPAAPQPLLTLRTGPGPRPLATRRRESRGSQNVAAQARAPRGDNANAAGLPPISPVVLLPLRAFALPPDLSSSVTAGTDASTRGAPPAAAQSTGGARLVASPEPRPGDRPANPWTGVADMGVDVGRASHAAGTATADFFQRFGQTLAGAF